MSNYRRASTSGGTYFFTVVTHHRQPFLTNDRFRGILRTVIETTRIQHPFIINAWVLLPDHLHYIWTLPDNDCDFSRRWGMIKARFSKQAKPFLQANKWLTTSKQKHRETTIWQRRFWEHQIRDEKDYQNHMDYIHYNPVKHGIVEHVSDWPYSTFHRYVQHGIYPRCWGDNINVENIEYGE